MMLNIPPYAAAVIEALEKNGHEAFAVGGCIRDTLLGRTPNDWDVTTSARPDEVRRLFSFLYGFSAIPTGIAHGTVTVLSEGKPVEVTTYRIDGEYTDHRRPDSVEFCKDLESDLSRRDFTVNAMAFSGSVGLVDPFGGADDLKGRIIRCVGDPKRRFSEDALRILRAVRFASVLGFDVESKTAEAALGMRGELSLVSRERVCSELSKLICGVKAAEVADKFFPIIEEILPNLRVIDRCLLTDSLEKLKGEHLPLMLSALLTECDADEARAMLRELRFDKKTCSRASLILENRGFVPDSKAAVKRLCRNIGTEAAEDVIRLGIARSEIAAFALCYLEEIRLLNECVSIPQLLVDGGDIRSLGADGRTVGQILDYILDKVIEGELENSRDALIPAIKQYIYNLEN